MRTQCKRFRQLVALLLSLTLASPATWAKPEAQSPSLIDRIIDSFSHNGIPDLNDPNQQKAFEFYVKKTFKGQTDIATPWQMNMVKAALGELTPPGKTLFGAADVEMQRRTFAVTPELKRFIGQQVKTAGYLKSLFLQPGANVGSWTKLKFEGHDFVRPEHVEILIEEVAPSTTLATNKELFNIYRSFFKHCNFPPPVTQRLTEGLIHMITMSNDAVIEALRSPRGEGVVAGLRSYYETRKRYESYFPEFRNAEPTPNILKRNLLTSEEFQKQISELEEQMHSGSHNQLNESFKVRPLSLVESPLRSCLASSDCSTRTYFNRALDPAFYYFTVTDQANNSRGHVTIALGKAFDGEAMRDVALIDKVQDIDTDKIDVVIEAVRQSVAKSNYTLALPTKLDDSHNGISNYPEIADHLAAMPTFTQHTKRLLKYRTSADQKIYSPGYSKAFEEGDVIALRPLSEVSSSTPDILGTRFTLHSPLQQTPAHIGLTAKEINDEIQRLESGSEDERIIYLELVDSIYHSQLNKSFNYVDNLEKWAIDKNLSIRLRNRTLKSILLIDPTRLPEIWPHFSADEIQTVLLSWTEQERLRISNENLRFAVLSALPHFRPTSIILNKLFDPRHFGIDGEANERLVQAAINTPRLVNTLKQIPNLKNDSVLRRFFVDFTIAIVLYQALTEAERDQDRQAIESLKEVTFSKLNQALQILMHFQKAEIKLIAEKIGPFLVNKNNQATFLNLVDEKIGQIQPLLLKDKLLNALSLTEAISYGVLGSVIATSFLAKEAILGPSEINIHLFLGAAAAAGITSLAKYNVSRQGQPIKFRQRNELEIYKTFKKAATNSIKKNCATLLTPGS